MVSSRSASRTRAISLNGWVIRMARSGGFVLILYLIPGLSYPAIISRDQSGEIEKSEAFTAEVGASGAIDATASHVFPKTGQVDIADTQIPGERQSDENQLSLRQKSETHPAHREISSFYLLVIVMVFALFIELTGNRFR
jgi:hypothetical protein